MTSPEQMKAKAREEACDAGDVFNRKVLTINQVEAIIEATYNARTQEVVEIAEKLAVGTDQRARRWIELPDLLKALSPEVKDDTIS